MREGEVDLLSALTATGGQPASSISFRASFTLSTCNDVAMTRVPGQTGPGFQHTYLLIVAHWVVVELVKGHIISLQQSHHHYQIHPIVKLKPTTTTMKSTEVLNPQRGLTFQRVPRIHADYTHAYNYTHGLRTCNGKVYRKLDVRQNGGLNRGKQITL